MVWSGVVVWAATEAPSEVADAGGGFVWEWSAPLIIAMFAGVVSVISLFVSRGNMKAAKASVAEAKRSTQVAMDQTDLQRNIALSAQKPEVWATLRPEPEGEGRLTLYAGNSGRSVARNVIVRIDLVSEPGEKPGIVELSRAAERFSLMSLVPGATHEWQTDMSYHRQDESDNMVRNLSVVWEDEHGYHDGVTYEVSLEEVRTTSRTWGGGFEALADLLRDIRG